MTMTLIYYKSYNCIYDQYYSRACQWPIAISFPVINIHFKEAHSRPQNPASSGFLSQSHRPRAICAKVRIRKYQY
jgi:hypothetical protein